MKKKYLWLALIAIFLNFSLGQAQCNNITAPYTEDFDTAAGSIPDCWSQGASNSENWLFKDNVGIDHIGNDGDFYGTNSASGGYFAWVNDSSPDNLGTTLESPEVDVSGLTDPGISFYMVSDNEGNTNVEFSVDVFDGSAWNDDMFTNNSNTGGWKKFYVSFATLNITGPVKVRFVIDETNGTDFYDDVAIDDIVFEEMPDCLEPNSLTVSNITSSGADLGWNPGGSETSWNVEVVPAGTAPTGTPTASGVGNPYTATGLSPQTDYDFYVQADCGVDGTSVWTGPVSFTTACASLVAPFVETFDVTSTPLCWEESGDSAWEYSTTVPGYAADNVTDHTPGGGTNFAVMDGSDNSNGDISTLTTPLVDVSGLTKPGVQFFMFSNNTNSAAINIVEVEFYDGSAWNNLTTVDDWLGDDWAFFIFDLSSYTITGDIRVRFTVTGTSVASAFHNDILIDDVEFLEAPDCIDPQNLEVSNVTLDSADVEWDDYSNSGMWNIEYGPAGFVQGSAAGTVVNVTSNPYTIPNLSEGIEYDVYVQADCGNGDLSSWIGPVSFETLKVGATCENAIDVTSLPYNFVGNTSNYQNNYSGVVGSDCGSDENYLNGFETFYEFTPANDDILSIQLSNLSGFYAGVFVYEDCADVGSQCVAGAVAGPSDDDLGIEDLNVTAGNTYYVVVSSWLNPSFGYTLDITGFDCNSFGAPIGEANQDLVLPATVSDLDVQGTMENVTFTYYDDAAGTNQIPASTPLVDGDTYYVSQTLLGCESPLLAITVNEIDCTIYGVTSTTDGDVTCKGMVTLQAQGSGNGSIFWFDAATGGNVVGSGSTFTTPDLTTTTSYWAAEVSLGNGGGSGSVPTGYCIPSYSNACTSGDLIEDVIIPNAGLNHVGSGCSPANYGDFTGDSNLVASFSVGQTYDFTVNHGPTWSQGIKIYLDLNQDGVFNETNELLFTSNGSALTHSGSIAIPAGNGGVTVMRVIDGFSTIPVDSCNPGSTFGEVHDYKAIVSEIICESPRVEAVATVNQTGDVVVGPLPYTSQDNTANYGNNFAGPAGTDCGGADPYLDGTDVVYEYTATQDDYINIELSGVTNDTAGVFVYDSCGDVGTACLAGAINEDGEYLIEDFFVTSGENYFIVISGSDGGTVGYTLDIYGYDCSELAAPIANDPQYFVAGNTLEDLIVEQDELSTTDVTWYSDDQGANEIPSTTQLVDGETYYVSQTVLDCESPLAAITVLEFECDDLGIVSVTDGEICQSGSTTIEAETTGITGDVYWYDAATGGNLVGVGSEFQTPNINTTTSYFAAEVFIQGASSQDGFALPAPTGTASTGLANYGLIFDVTAPFTLLSVDVYPDSSTSSTLTFELRDDSGNVLQSGSYALPSGDGVTAVTVPVNFVIPPGTGYRLMKTSSNTMIRDFNGINFPYELGPGGSLGSVTSGAFGTGTSTSYYFFYNWNVSVGQVVCESDRMESVVTVNDVIPAKPTGNANQDLCEGNTIADLVANGDNIQWYSAATNGEIIPEDTLLEDGGTYYATQTVGGCESDETFEVTVTLTELSDTPDGDVNQSFVLGETVADLDVNGSNLVWYSDPEGNNPIGTDVELEDQNTYYVGQTTSDQCESSLLGVTVHRILSVGGDLIEGLTYYPNPVKSRLTISSAKSIDSVEFYNLLGQQVMMTQLGSTEATIDVARLASGTYLIRVNTDNKTGVYKLIKE